MSTTDDRGATAGADLAGALRDAPLAHLVVHADGDALAAAALLARALADRGTPYQVSAVRTGDDAARRAAASDADAAVVGVGCSPASTDAALAGRPASAGAYDAATGLTDPGPDAATLALAGVVAAGGTPERDAPDAADAAPAERRPGIGAPTEAPTDGLAHSTLVHAPFSGDPPAAEDAVDDLGVAAEPDRDDRRRLASTVALDAEVDGDALERALRPLAPGGPVATVEGYADVLDAVARTDPGTALGLALGHDLVDTALEAWREAALAAHAGVRSAEPARHDGVVVGAVDDGPLWTVARLLRDGGPEPAALAIGDDAVALAASGDARERLAAAASTGAVGSDRLAYAEPAEPSAVAEALGGKR